MRTWLDSVIEHKNTGTVDHSYNWCIHGTVKSA